jgi:hypothetical protein
MLQESKVQQIEKALKSNAKLKQRVDKMLSEGRPLTSVDSLYQRQLIKDKENLTKMLNKAKKKNK